MREEHITLDAALKFFASDKASKKHLAELCEEIPATRNKVSLRKRTKRQSDVKKPRRKGQRGVKKYQN